jgi:hypothetical protein
MPLIEFLATADSDHAIALTQARSLEESQGKVITSNVLTMLLVGEGLYGYFRDCSVDTQHPARDICLALMDRLRTQSEFNFIPGDPKGVANNGMIDLLISTLMTEKQAELGALRTSLTAEASTTNKPFEQTTLHDVLLTRGVCPVQPVTQSDGYATIVVTQSVEKHNPRLLADNPRTGERVRIESFRGVANAGAYDTKVPPEWRGVNLFVDDAYGVI